MGPGDYDVWAIRWGYGIFPAGTERDSLAAIVAEGLKKGYLYLSDADARPEYASDPRTNLWDDAATPMEFLARQVAVRRVALDRFGLRNIGVGEPVATLQERLAPLYFFHRFAINGVTKTIGGMEYANAVRGDNQTETRPVSGARQRAALSALLAELQPSELAIPDSVLTLLGPRPSGYNGPVNNSNSPVGELFRGRTDPAFDELAAARTLAQMIVDGILQPERAARVVAFATRGPEYAHARRGGRLTRRAHLEPARRRAQGDGTASGVAAGRGRPPDRPRRGYGSGARSARRGGIRNRPPAWRRRAPCPGGRHDEPRALGIHRR